MGEVIRIPAESRAPTVTRAAKTFVAAHRAADAWAEGTAVKYEQTLTAITRRLPAAIADDLRALDTPVGAAALDNAFNDAFGQTAAATRARHLAALRSAIAWWQTKGWLTNDPTIGWPRPKPLVDTTRALTRDQIAELLRTDASLRDKTLWRLLYETAARAEEILTLDIGDLDLPNKRARVVSKGGSIDWVHWQTGAARLLPRLLRGRTRGPVFLATRLPTREVPAVDLCPETGRARLSYRRAAELFEKTTRPLANPAPGAAQTQRGWTLHQLRHSALTHDAETGTNTPMLLSRSRHASVRSLERYARPGPEAVAAHVAAADPAARRRGR